MSTLIENAPITFGAVFKKTFTFILKNFFWILIIAAFVAAPKVVQSYFSTILKDANSMEAIKIQLLCLSFIMLIGPLVDAILILHLSDQ